METSLQTQVYELGNKVSKIIATAGKLTKSLVPRYFVLVSTSPQGFSCNISRTTLRFIKSDREISKLRESLLELRSLIDGALEHAAEIENSGIYAEEVENV